MCDMSIGASWKRALFHLINCLLNGDVNHSGALGLVHCELFFMHIVWNGRYWSCSHWWLIREGDTCSHGHF